MSVVNNEFDKYGFKIVEKIFHPRLASLLHQYVLAYEREYKPDSDQWVAGAAAVYGDPIVEQLFDQVLPVARGVAERLLFPTYAYFRVYHHGESLLRHSDRPSCEVSVSLSLGNCNAEPWPLFIEGPLGVKPVILKPGDGVVYKGCDCPHWRDPLVGNSSAQVFYHFVDQEGHYSNWKFDKRPSLNLEAGEIHRRLTSSLKKNRLYPSNRQNQTRN